MRPAPLLAAALLALACDEPAPAQKPAGRFAAVSAAESKPASKAATSFCDKVFPASGPESRKFVEPPSRPIPGYGAQNQKGPSWRWVNLWATWCTPCVEELPLLERWSAALAKEGRKVSFDLVSLDEEEAPLVERVKKPMPGPVTWLRGPDDQKALLESLGVEASSAIPIHALVDPAGQLRCVRVGAVHDGDYPAVLSILAD